MWYDACVSDDYRLRYTSGEGPIFKSISVTFSCDSWSQNPEKKKVQLSKLKLEIDLLYSNSLELGAVEMQNQLWSPQTPGSKLPSSESLFASNETLFSKSL